MKNNIDETLLDIVRSAAKEAYDKVIERGLNEELAQAVVIRGLEIITEYAKANPHYLNFEMTKVISDAYGRGTTLSSYRRPKSRIVEVA